MSIIESGTLRTRIETLENENALFRQEREVTHDVDRFLEEFRKVPHYAAYHFIPPGAQRVIDQFTARHSIEEIHNFLQLALIRAARNIDQFCTEIDIPDSIQALYPRNLKRILDESTSHSIDFYDLKNDRFVKDLCIFTVRMLPCGGRLLETLCGLPRRLILQGGIAKAPLALANVTFKLRGFRPLVQFHTHTSDLQDFNPEGMRRTYHRVADLLASRTHLLGLYTASWFNDPKVSEISPRLAYLREVPENNGAFLLPRFHRREQYCRGHFAVKDTENFVS